MACEPMPKASKDYSAWCAIARARAAERPFVPVRQSIAYETESACVGRKWSLGMCETFGTGTFRLAGCERPGKPPAESGRVVDAGERNGAQASEFKAWLATAHVGSIKQIVRRVFVRKRARMCGEIRLK